MIDANYSSYWNDCRRKVLFQSNTMTDRIMFRRARRRTPPSTPRPRRKPPWRKSPRLPENSLPKSWKQRWQPHLFIFVEWWKLKFSLITSWMITLSSWFYRFKDRIFFCGVFLWLIMISLQLAREEEEKQMTLDEWKKLQAKKVISQRSSAVKILKLL